MKAIRNITAMNNDMFEMVISNLTGKGIKYGEENFDEPTYILLLREIIKKCDLKKI